MKLLDLNPRWIGMDSILTGISFLCPHCKTTRLAVHFSNPIDPNGWLQKGVTRHHYPYEWQRTGDSFESLTLTPSVDAFSPAIGADGHWHGFITNGEIT